MTRTSKQLTKTKDRFRAAVQPPVHQVKVVGRFVDHQTTGIGFIAVPAAEVVGPVAGIQQPFKMDRHYIADSARLQNLFNF